MRTSLEIVPGPPRFIQAAVISTVGAGTSIRVSFRRPFRRALRLDIWCSRAAMENPRHGIAELLIGVRQDPFALVARSDGQHCSAVKCAVAQSVQGQICIAQFELDR